MNEKELALKLKNETTLMQNEIKDFLGQNIFLDNPILKDINIDKLIIEAKKINLFIDYAPNVKFIKCNKKERNSIFVYLNDYNL